MMPADLDDEQRAHHPTDLDFESGTSSPSSGVPSFLNVNANARRRSKSASHHRSNTTADGSSSSHLLARLVSCEEEVREVNAALAVTSERLESESSRANAAERRALDYFHRLRIATENRERADQETARLREELKLYKMQLENAQKEIFRAQDIIDQVANQRNEAEAEAARARTKARKLQEEKLVMLAREEGRRMGYQEGLSVGRRIGYDQEQHDGDDTIREHEGITDDERINDPRAHLELHSRTSTRTPTRPESAPPVRALENALYAPPLPLPVRVRTPSHDRRTPTPTHRPRESEPIHPIPIRPSPVVPTQPINPPPDGWIPRADSRTSYIPVPPPHELQHPVPSPTSVVGELRDGQFKPTQQSTPTPVPPPVVRSHDYAYQAPAPPPIQRIHTPSIASRTSTAISQYDIVNKRPSSSLRNEIYRERTESLPSRESMSRNEHRDQERRLSTRTEAEHIAEKWRADSDSESPPRNPPRSFTPSAARRPVHFYYQPRETASPAPPEDDPRSRTPVPTESTGQPPRQPYDDPTGRTRTPFEHLRQRFRRRSSSKSSSIPNIVVESPSEPETTMSPATTIAAHPELLSPESANRPLPVQDDPGQQPQPSSYTPRHEPPRSGTPQGSWPAGFMPYAPADKDHHRHHRRAPEPEPGLGPDPHARARPPDRMRARTQSASAGGGRVYEAAPLPPGVMYPAPPPRPQTSHRRQRDSDERAREVRWEPERDERDRDRRRGDDRDRDRERHRDRDRDRDRDRSEDELTRSPAPLQRPISLFDSDESR